MWIPKINYKMIIVLNRHLKFRLSLRKKTGQTDIYQVYRGFYSVLSCTWVRYLEGAEGMPNTTNSSSVTLWNVCVYTQYYMPDL